jgi:hypothetical protein
MKNLKQIIAQVQTPGIEQTEGFNDILWQLICYSPKMTARLQQEQLIAEAVKFTLPVMDEFFEHKELQFNGFIWGGGKHKILITHGWGSKAADFIDMITKLREIDDVQIIAFDAPGNGSSEGYLSNLLLYVAAIKAITLKYGKPAVTIGHSLGGIANAIAFTEMRSAPDLLISIAPLIRLKENFEASMSRFGVSHEKQQLFFQSFESKFHRTASSYNLKDWYTFDVQHKHWLAYDENDLISPYSYLKEFLDANPFIESQNYPDVGHDRIIKSTPLIDDMIAIVTSTLHR